MDPFRTENRLLLRINLIVFLFLFLTCDRNHPDVLQSIAPGKKMSEHQEQYHLLQQYLLSYQEIEGRGGWPALKLSTDLKPGDKDELVSTLRDRLSISGDYENKRAEPADSFDISLSQALKKFQKRHGLEQNGILNKRSAEELNVPVEERLRQIELNMKRWLQLTQIKDSLYVFVNSAAYLLEVVQNNSTPLRMKVIVGREYRKTPEIQSQITSIEFNPFWYIPPNILKQDILPLIKKDEDYLSKKGIYVFEDGKRLEDGKLRKRKLKDGEYQLAQPPGPDNPMGLVKFLFPNQYKVYMHDTPDKKLFDTEAPTFSSGCIRLSRALELARFLLKQDKGWKNEKVDSLISTGKTIRINLNRPVKIYVEYITAWVGEDGALYLYPDIYKRDEAEMK